MQPVLDKFPTVLGRFIVRHLRPLPLVIPAWLGAEAHDLEEERNHVLARSRPRPQQEGPSRRGTALLASGSCSVLYSLHVQRSAAYPARPARPLPRSKIEPGSGTNIAAAQSSAKRKLTSSASPFCSILQIHSPYCGNVVHGSTSALNPLRILLMVVLGRSHLCCGRI